MAAIPCRQIFQRAGQPAPYLIAQLQNFRNHSRSDLEATEYMWGIRGTGLKK